MINPQINQCYEETARYTLQNVAWYRTIEMDPVTGNRSARKNMIRWFQRSPNPSINFHSRLEPKAQVFVESRNQLLLEAVGSGWFVFPCHLTEHDFTKASQLQLLGRQTSGFPLTHSHSERQKQAWQFWKYFSNKSIFRKIFEREMLTRCQTTTLLRIFCELSLYSKVIFKSMKAADDKFSKWCFN